MWSARGRHPIIMSDGVIITFTLNKDTERLLEATARQKMRRQKRCAIPRRLPVLTPISKVMAVVHRHIPVN